MIQKTAISLFFLVLLILLAFSCKQEKNYAHEIHQLDSLLNLTTEKIQSAPFAEGPNSDTIQVQLQYIQNNYVGSMHESMAEALSEFSLLRKNKEELESMRDSIVIHFEHTQKRCKELEQAIQEKATHDASNQKIDEAYIDQAFKTESTGLNTLIEKNNEWCKQKAELNTKYESLLPQIKFWTDSIPLRKQYHEKH